MTTITPHAPDTVLPTLRERFFTSTQEDIPNWRVSSLWSEETVHKFLAIEEFDRQLEGGGPKNAEALLEEYQTAIRHAATQSDEERARNAVGTARFRMGVRYENGNGVPLDPNMALAWYRAGTLTYHLPSVLCLGLALIKDTGKEQQEEGCGLLERAFNFCYDNNSTPEYWGTRTAQGALEVAQYLESFDIKRASILLQRVKFSAERFKLPPEDLGKVNQLIDRMGESFDYTHYIQVVKSIAPSPDKEINNKINVFKPLNQLVPLGGIPNLRLLEETLNQEFPWMRTITSHVLLQLHLLMYAGRNIFFLRPLLLVGDAGIGKTRYCKRLAELSGVPFRILPVGGSSDNRSLRGTARGWSTGEPCLPLRAMQQEMIANPMILLDELDKSGGSDRNGWIANTLHLLTERETASHFFDEYLEGTSDLSWVSWIATANDISTMPSSLLGRFTVLKAPEPKRDHYPAIVHGVLDDLAKTLGIDRKRLPEPGEAEWRWLEQYFTSPRLTKKAVELLVGQMIRPVLH